MPPVVSPPRNNTGFVPLNNATSSSSTAMASQDIPLTQVKSHASSTGARRPNMGTSTSLDTDTKPMDEKRGLFHRSGGRRKKKEQEALARQNSGNSDEVKLNAMGRLYTAIIGASVVTRYLVYIVPIAFLLAVPLIILPVTGHKDDINVGNQAGPEPNSTIIGPSLFLVFLWVEISWLSLWIGKVVAWLLPTIFMFFCGVVSSGTRKYATVLRNLEIAFSMFFWALASWLTFKNLFNTVNDRGIIWVRNFEKVLGATFVCSAVYLAEKAVVQLIGISYHQRSFANRIKDSKREIHLLGMLYDASRTLFPMYCQEFAEEDYVINDSIDILLAGGVIPGHKKSGSVTPMRLVGDVGRFGDKVTSVFGQIALEITGKKVFNPNSAHSIVVEALEKLAPTEALAKRIWMSFVVEGKDALYLEDIQEVLGPAHADEATEAFNAIDSDQNGDISLDEMVRKVVEIGKERKAIGEGMKDISQALRVFDKVLLFVVLLICVFIFLAFFQSSFITTLATAGTALLSLSFVFAVTTQEFLGSCIFLFVKHPYDVGDRVDISNMQLTVDKISLLYSVFTRIDKMQVVQVPNIVLNNLWIENVSRSKAMKEVIDVNISYDTSFEDIELLRLEMEKFVRSPENSRDFQPDLAIGVGGVGDLDKLNLKIAIKHKSNWHNEAVRVSRRSKFMCALALALKKVPIYNPGGGNEALGSVGNPSYSVAVDDPFAAAKRDEASDKKEAKRMVPSKPAVAPKSELTTSAEKQAINELTTTNPIADAQDDWTLNRDDKTAAASTREASAEQRRSNDIERVRQDLLKRESQRGRRRAGESLPPTALGDNAPGVQLTQASPRLATFDEEAQTGMPRPYQAGGFYGGSTTPVHGTQPQYSIFPSQQRTSPPGSSSGFTAQPPQAPHPLQSQPVPPGQPALGQGMSRGGPSQPGMPQGLPPNMR